MFRSIEDIYKEKEEKEKITQLPSIRKLKTYKKQLDNEGMPSLSNSI